MTNDVIQYLILETNGEKHKNKISAKKFDTKTRKVNITLAKRGAVINLDKALMAVVKCNKPDGTNIYNDCVIDGNSIRYEMTTQMLSVAGDVICEVEVTWEDGSVITSPQYTLHVYDTVSTGVESTNEYNGIVQALASTIEVKNQTIAVKNEAVAEINTATSTGTSAIDSAKQSALTSISTVTSSGTSAITSAKQSALTDIATEKSSSLSAISSAKSDALSSMGAYVTASEGYANTALSASSSASASSTSASSSATLAESKSTLAESYAKGGTGTRTGEDSDNAKYYMEQAKAVAKVDIATTEIAGIVKPDGTTITVEADGTIHGSATVDIATTTSVGTVKPDGTTITIDTDGTIHGAETGEQSDWNVTDTESLAYIKNKPSIPSEVTESTVSGWGFTKNTGTYIKPDTGIPASDIASGVIPTIPSNLVRYTSETSTLDTMPRDADILGGKYTSSDIDDMADDIFEIRADVNTNTTNIATANTNITALSENLTSINNRLYKLDYSNIVNITATTYKCPSEGVISFGFYNTYAGISVIGVKSDKHNYIRTNSVAQGCGNTIIFPCNKDETITIICSTGSYGVWHKIFIPYVQ